MSKKLEPCADCSGITYRQTTSGEIIPASHICPSKITPPCYQPDGDGCAYQTYGDGGEPIDKCKECPHCYTDKVRHESNDPLTLEELREMGGEPVWFVPKQAGINSGWRIIQSGRIPLRWHNDTVMSARAEDVGRLFDVYRRPPEGGVAMRNLPEKVRRELDAKAASEARRNQPKPTNSDRIRAMSDEELADWLVYSVCKYTKCGDDCPVLSAESQGDRVCAANILHWLTQPAQEE